MNTERLHDVIQAVSPDFHGLSYRERLIVGAVLKRLSTPPADDVRETLARAIWQASPDLERAVLADARLIADAVLANPEVEVRPRGTVTDADELDEALWGVIMNAINGTHSAQSIASAVRASFDVRFRETYCETEPSDAQVLAGLNAELPRKSAAPSLDFYGGDNVTRMRRILREAAREAGS